MQSLIRLTTLLRNLFRKARADRDLDEEIRSYAAFLAEAKAAPMSGHDHGRAAYRLLTGAPSVPRRSNRSTALPVTREPTRCAWDLTRSNLAWRSMQNIRMA